jgi:hypothetical protein
MCTAHMMHSIAPRPDAARAVNAAGAERLSERPRGRMILRRVFRVKLLVVNLLPNGRLEQAPSSLLTLGSPMGHSGTVVFLPVQLIPSAL